MRHLLHINVNFTDDIVLYFIYDNVEFKDSKCEKIKLQSQIKLFEDCDESKRAYVWNL